MVKKATPGTAQGAEIPDEKLDDGAAPAAPETVSVAYFDGPPSISLAGRAWQLARSQPLPAEEWQNLRQHPLAAPYRFKELAAATTGTAQPEE